MDRDRILDVIRAHAAEVLSIGPEQVVPGGKLVELGANSIDRLEIVTLSLEELNLKIPLVELAQIDGIAGLVDFLHDKLGNQERGTGAR